MGMEREDIWQKTMQHPNYMNTYQWGEIKQSSNNWKKKKQARTEKANTLRNFHYNKIRTDHKEIRETSGITVTQWH